MIVAVADAASSTVFYGGMIAVAGTLAVLCGFLVGTNRSVARGMNRLGTAAIGLGTALAFYPPDSGYAGEHYVLSRVAYLVLLVIAVVLSVLTVMARRDVLPSKNRRDAK